MNGNEIKTFEGVERMADWSRVQRNAQRNGEMLDSVPKSGGGC
jgi:hypothetical protein